MEIRIHRILPKTEVEGPGTRCCIWVQGCPLHCKGCGAKETWDFKGGELLDTNEVFDIIKNSKEIEGVTFLGGEPFVQASAVYDIALRAKSIGLTVLTFTGYTYDHILKSNKKEWNDLLSVTDLLIDGPFDEDKFDISRPWVGSSNQNYRFLSSSYKHLENNLNSIKNKIEVRLHKNGTIFLNGMGDFNSLKNKLKNLEDGE
ncbi:4Fe-4S single cluster domain-containing protein [Clostridium combesii]|uniref:Ribonucleoside-triphosphate reductase activating protein n=1 Tax=Clostridium combesii TaxID=39481 RepID=A0A2G7HLV0_9CLOT|nr:4Fe-4S single cluster domain-containing protein [Clostridium combesii]PIH06034.1 ribonucleoside-triphosphate reductase activating protein [Clostridium combesii]